MYYLNEEASEFQIKECQKHQDKVGFICPKCKMIKKASSLCPLGKAWMTPLPGENG